MEKPNEGVYKFAGKNVQRLFVLVMNEWQVGEKDVRMVCPSRFANGVYKIPKISSVSVNRVGSPDICIQTNINGFVPADKVKV